MYSFVLVNLMRPRVHQFKKIENMDTHKNEKKNNGDVGVLNSRKSRYQWSILIMSIVIFTMVTGCSTENRLISALKTSNCEKAEGFIDVTDNFNFLGREGSLPLNLATLYCPELVPKLLEKGADPNLTDVRGEIPLNVAIDKRPELVPMLLEKGADPNLIDVKGEITLNIAIDKRPELVPMLLEKGAKPKLVNSNGDTPLDAAVRNGNADMVKLLIDAGADINGLTKTGTPLSRAIKNHNYEAMKLLIDAGADVNTLIPFQGDSSEKLPDKLLLEFTFSHDEAKPFPKPLTDYEAMKLLIDAGANVNAKNGDGNTIINNSHFLIGCAECVKLLIDAGANVNTKDIYGITPLHGILLESQFQPEYLDPDLISFLIESGADPYYALKGGYTAMIIAKNAIRFLRKRIDEGCYSTHHSHEPDYINICIENSKKGVDNLLKVVNILEAAKRR